MQTIQLTPRQKQAAAELLKLPTKYRWHITPSTEPSSIVVSRPSQSAYKNGRWKTVTSALHIARVTNYCTISKSGRTMERFIFSSLNAKVEKSKVMLPVGYQFSADKLGLRVVRSSDGRDYHLDAYEPSICTGESLLARLASLDAKRDAEQQAQRTRQQREAAFTADLNTTRVNLWDSRQAGNCVTGSLAFAKRLGVSESDAVTLNSPGVSAKTLVRSGDSRAIAASWKAWERETMVSI